MRIKSMREILNILENLDWSPFWISLKTGVVATFFCFFLGIFAAGKIMKAGSRSRAVIDGILDRKSVV